MADFDETTTDPVKLMAMYSELEMGGGNTLEIPADGTPPAAPAPAPAPAPEVPAAPPAAPVAETPAAPAAADPDPDGVATKDGKHIIPYSVLQSEREARTKAEAQAAELQKRVEAAEAAARAALEPGEKPGGAAPASKQAPAADDLTDEELETLNEDFPTVYKGLMATRAAADRLAAQLKPVEEVVQTTQAQREADIRAESQAAVDAHPKLAHIQASDKVAWEQAKQFDDILKLQPAWAGKPPVERFAKVVEMLETANGQIVIPGAAPAQPAPTQEELKKQAQATAAAAAAKHANAGNVPISLTSFPAGQAPATSDREAVEQMSTAQLHAKMASMSPEQLEKFMSEI